MSFALLCPGQGAQTPGFLREALDGAPDLALALEAALEMPLGQIHALGAEALRKNAIAQPCIMAWQLAQWSRLAPHLPPPALAMGYSLGEVSAFVLASGCVPARALALARQRAQAMDAACPRPGAMLALRGLRQDAVRALCAGLGWHVAIRNGEDRVVVAGEWIGREAVEAAALAAGAAVSILGVTTPSHTPLLAAAVAPFRAALEEEAPASLAFPLISASEGRLLRKAAQVRDSLARQLAAPLDWAGALDALVERGIDVCLELGPGADLSRMLRERCAHVRVRSLCEFATPEAALAWVQRALADAG